METLEFANFMRIEILLDFETTENVVGCFLAHGANYWYNNELHQNLNFSQVLIINYWRF